jgi:hypothetical protein
LCLNRWVFGDVRKGGKATLGGRLAFPDSFPQLRAEFWTILVSMYLCRVLSCSIDEFILASARS